jgi:hypothetical protein
MLDLEMLSLIHTICFFVALHLRFLSQVFLRAAESQWFAAIYIYIYIVHYLA